MNLLDTTHFITDAINTVPGMNTPEMSDNAYLTGVLLFPALLWGLFTGQTG